jgi:NADPH2:quinone reductase
MQAIRVHQFGDPSVLKLETLSDPQPGPTQAVVRLRAIGVNPVDCYIRSGIYGPREFPFTPGYDGAGDVERVGSAVHDFRAGDRVIAYRPPSGTYGERIACDVKHLFRLPAPCSFEQGAAVGVPYLTALVALFQRGRARAGESVLVHGASGGVGLAAVQLAAGAGLRVLGTASTPAGRALVREQGAAEVFDHSANGYLEQIRNATAGRGPDLILEMLANVNLENDLTLLAPRGRVVIIGSRGQITITPRHTMGKNLDVLGMSLNTATEAEIRDGFGRIVEGLEKGTLRPIVAETLPLAEAARAHEKIMSPGALGKIVLIP